MLSLSALNSMQSQSQIDAENEQSRVSQQQYSSVQPSCTPGQSGMLQLENNSLAFN